MDQRPSDRITYRDEQQRNMVQSMKESMKSKSEEDVQVGVSFRRNMRVQRQVMFRPAKEVILSVAAVKMARIMSSVAAVAVLALATTVSGQNSSCKTYPGMKRWPSVPSR